MGEAWRRMLESRDVARFYAAWAAGNRAGLTYLQVLQAMIRGDAGPAGRRRALPLLWAVQNQRSLTTALEKARHAFTDLERTLIELGEERGRLDEQLAQLAAFFEADHRVTLKIRGRLLYVLLSPLAGALVLPLALAWSLSPAAYAVFALGGVALVVALGGTLAWTAFQLERGRPRWAMARLCRALATAMETAMPLERAIAVAARVVAPSRLARDLERMPPEARRGKPLSVTLGATGRVPPHLSATLENAERSGETAGTLRHLADLYEQGAV